MPTPSGPKAPLDRSPAVTLLVVHGGSMLFCSAVSSVWTSLWIAGLWVCLTDPTTPGVVTAIVGMAVVARLILPFLTMATLAIALVAAMSLRRGQRRFVVAAALTALLAPVAQVTVALLTLDILSPVWMVSILLGTATCFVSLASLSGTASGRDPNW